MTRDEKKQKVWDISMMINRYQKLINDLMLEANRLNKELQEDPASAREIATIEEGILNPTPVEVPIMEEPA